MHRKQLVCVTADKQLTRSQNWEIAWWGTDDDSVLVSNNLLCGFHDVPAAAVLHVRPFLRLLSEVHLIGAFPKLTLEGRHEGVCRSWPVTVGRTRMSVVAAVAHVAVAVTLQHARRFVAEVEKPFNSWGCQGNCLSDFHHIYWRKYEEMHHHHIKCNFPLHFLTSPNGLS